MDQKNRPWFWGAVGYEIYPRSFMDSDNNGIGDLKGIISKLDYLAGKPDSLGVNVIWICPFYRSPMADFGYDVEDYFDIDPIFGTIDDFRLLVKSAHERGVKVLIDLVVNHTSDTHSWFKESRISRENPKRDWYIWHQPNADGTAPNNWRSVFGGSAWEYDSLTSQYYLHSFSVKQPDLNWDNPEVREAIKSVMKFWLNLGVDGFRADAVYWLSKDVMLRNDPLDPSPDILGVPDYEALSHEFSRAGPRLYDYLSEILAVYDDYSDRFLIVEAYPEGGKEVSEYLKFYKNIDEEHSAPFIFEGIHFSNDIMGFKNFVDEFQSAIDNTSLPIYTFGNHDKRRLASRVGPQPLRAIATMLLTLPGMPFIYYGEEIGMSDVNLREGTQKDPMANKGKSRDAERSPMQWSSARNAGFSSSQPWLPLPENYDSENVDTELRNPNSLLNLYRQLIKLRAGSEALKYGNYESLELGKNVYGYIRRSGLEQLMVLLNFGSDAATIALGSLSATMILSTHLTKDGKPITGKIELLANEGVILRLA